MYFITQAGFCQRFFAIIFIFFKKNVFCAVLRGFVPPARAHTHSSGRVFASHLPVRSAAAAVSGPGSLHDIPHLRRLFRGKMRPKAAN